MNDPLVLSREDAESLAEIPMRCIGREFPNAPGLWLESATDLRTPRELHPAFYGCLDWHSAVHMHWTLIRLLRKFEVSRGKEIRAQLDEHFTEPNLRTEADYFEYRPTFERTYGWAWLLTLAGELWQWKQDSDATKWLKNLRPLEETIVRRFEEFLPKQTYPIRTGTHGNTAFSLILALDYARETSNRTLESLIQKRSREYYLGDRLNPAPLSYEPCGNDFLSPALVEATLMSKVLDCEDFRSWFSGFLPDLSPLLIPATVSDRSDPQIAHLDGLNLSRAWCMRELVRTLLDTPYHQVLIEAARAHAIRGRASLKTGHYEGEHWLASFAMLLLT